ncbi:MAG: hypothetical protein LBV40_08645 [Methanomicrobiales archaeon]|nr:hypothetical protein [Methanomicrobiales archaeon]
MRICIKTKVLTLVFDTPYLELNGLLERTLENVVFLELYRRGYEIYIGKVGTVEVDFIVIGDDGEEYFQVAYTVIDTSGATLRRELAPLEAIHDHNQKYLLTMDNTPLTSPNGIKQINVFDWLLK